MKSLIARVLCLLGVPAIYRWLNRHRLVILMYHGVVDRPLAPPCWTQLPRERFERQIRWIARRYRVLPLEEALDRWGAGTLPPRSCAITFDDGFRNNATVAGPILGSLGLHATVFLATGSIGTGRSTWTDRVWLAVTEGIARTSGMLPSGLRAEDLATPEARAAAASRIAGGLKGRPRAEKEAAVEALVSALGAPRIPPEFEMLDWGEVAAMVASGRFAFGAHTVHHEILSKCDDETVRREVRESQAEVAHHTGHAPRVFAWPNGRTQDFDGRAVQAAREAGCSYALATIEGLVGRHEHPFSLPRVAVGADLSFDRFRLLASGVLPLRRAPAPTAR